MLPPLRRKVLDRHPTHDANPDTWAIGLQCNDTCAFQIQALLPTVSFLGYNDTDRGVTLMRDEWHYIQVPINDPELEGNLTIACAGRRVTVLCDAANLPTLVDYDIEGRSSVTQEIPDQSSMYVGSL